MSGDGGASGPLAGVRVLELGGVGPVAFTGTVLADLGADVVRLERPGAPAVHTILQRGRRIVATDLRVDAALVLDLAARAEVVLEGFRPGVVERLGLGPDEVLRRNPAVVYGRMSGFGRTGEHATAPGHDLNYAAVSGALHLMRGADGAPVVTPGLVGDFGGGGSTLAYGVLAALRSGVGQVVDCSIVRSTAMLTSAARELAAQGEAAVRTGAGDAPFYRCYACADGRYVAVGAVETPFYRALCSLCGVEDGDQHDPATWPDRVAAFTEAFAGRTRDEWCADPRAADACVSPVLDLDEAAEHPRNAGVFADGQPGIGPVLSATPGAAREPARPSEFDEVRVSWTG